MDPASAIPLWFAAVMIYLLRVSDVTLGTVRTVTIVKGYIGLSMLLGFFEVVIWVVAISQVLTRLDESWLLAVAYAGGFATGNGVGILIERKLALGVTVIRMISSRSGEHIAAALRSESRTVTTFTGDGLAGPVTLVYVACPRREVPSILRTAQTIDPELFYVTEPAHETNRSLRLRPVPLATGWRAVFKRK